MDKACERFTEMIPQYLSGELSEKEKAEFEAHVAGCASCREELRLTEAIRSSADEPPAELLTGVMVAVRAEADVNRFRNNAPKRGRLALVRRLSVAAAALIVVVGAAAAIPNLTSDRLKGESSASENVTSLQKDDYSRSEPTPEPAEEAPTFDEFVNSIEGGVGVIAYEGGRTEDWAAEPDYDKSAAPDDDSYASGSEFDTSRLTAPSDINGSKPSKSITNGTGTEAPTGSEDPDVSFDLVRYGAGYVIENYPELFN